jgi:hypothetical protein
MLKDSYKHLLTGVWILIPIVVLVWRNGFRSRRATLLRAVGATLAAWAWLFASAMAVTKIDLALATSQAEVDRVVMGDGARHLGALLAGWLPSAVLTLACWAVIRGWRAIRRDEPDAGSLAHRGH